MQTPQGQSSRWWLWVDGCGGFLVLTSPRLTIGRAASEGLGVRESPDVEVMADLPRVAAWLERTGDGISMTTAAFPTLGIEPSSQPVAMSPDRKGKLAIGATRWDVAMPGEVSRSAMLRVQPPHRLGAPVDAVVWIDGAVTIGSSNQHAIRRLGLNDWYVLQAPGAEHGWRLRRTRDRLQTDLVPGRRELVDELSLVIQPQKELS